MAPDLRDAQLAAELADVVADFLPGKPHPYGSAELSFPAAAAAVGVGGYWGGGSKRPALTELFARTLAQARQRFCPLVLEIVRRAISYRSSPKQSPLMREDVERVNAVLQDIGFRIPELSDPKFLSTLPASRPSADDKPPTSAGRNPADARSPDRALEPRVREKLLADLAAVSALAPTPRGLAFEPFLATLFDASGLAPRNAFSLKGEQIDGSFSLDGATYLLEAKWKADRTGQADLLVFSGKVGGKAGWARGLFVAYSGFTAEGLEAFARGRGTNIICADGLDLFHVLSGQLSLVEVLRAKARQAVESGRAFVPVRELFHNVT